MRSVVRIFAFACLMIAAGLAGLGSSVGVASLTSAPILFLGAGWLAFALGVCIAARVTVPHHHWQIAAISLAAWSLAGGFALLWPASQKEPLPPPGTRWITLSTGSRLAYLKLPAAEEREGVPVLFLHGGPAVADMTGDAAWMRRLAADGYDVYLYDQVGAGRSTRLPDPTGYTRARAVADLDAFREQIVGPKVDLLGYSWGATLAAAYLAEHPDHVAKVVFISPGSMVGGRSNLMDLLSRLSAAHLWHVLSGALEPSALQTWLLVQVNPHAAHAYAGDAEMDGRFRGIVAATATALYCHAPAEAEEDADPGFYANAMLLRPTAWRGIDPRDALRRLDTPALVVKGACDYLSWSSATDYRDTMPKASMAYVHGAGHRVYAERPDVFFPVVNAFLAGQALPIPLEMRSLPPPSYQGPRG